MKTMELTEALARLKQDGETAVAKAAELELQALTERVTALEQGIDQAIHEIKMQYCLRFREANFEQAAEKSEVVIELRRLLAEAQ